MEIKEEDYQKAVAVVRKSLSGSVSNIQRKLYWGYCRAASAVDRMQNEFIVSPMSASGRREVYPEEMHEVWKELQAAKQQATPEGFVLIADNSKTVVAIEKMVEQQVEASGITQDVFRLDGHRILEAMIEAQEQSHG